MNADVRFQVVVRVKGVDHVSPEMSFKDASAKARELAAKNKAAVQVRRVVA